MPVPLRLTKIKGTVVDAEAGDFKIQTFGYNTGNDEPFAKEYAYNTADQFIDVFNASPPVVDGVLDI